VQENKLIRSNKGSTGEWEKCIRSAKKGLSNIQCQTNKKWILQNKKHRTKPMENELQKINNEERVQEA
jgi:hypothetical protein